MCYVLRWHTAKYTSEKRMPPIQSDAGTTDDNYDGDVDQASAIAPLAPDGVIHEESEPVRLCLLDSNGIQTNISLRKHVKAAAALLTILDRRIGLGREEEMEMFSTATDAPQTQLLDEVKRFELFRSVIQHEDDLLNQRVSWIILAQSFLVAAFITNTSNDGSGDALKLITAIVGLSTVIVTMPAILAAGRNIELQQQVYFSGIISEGELFFYPGALFHFSVERIQNLLIMRIVCLSILE